MTARAMSKLHLVAFIAHHQGAAKSTGTTINNGLKCPPLVCGDLIAILMDQ